MDIWRYYKNGEYGKWNFAPVTLAEKIAMQRKVKDFAGQLRKARLAYYESEPHGQAQYDLFARCIRVHKRRGYEIHELIQEA